MVAVRLFVEGGGDSNDLRTECRRGFRIFLERAGLGGSMPRIIACGSRQDAYRSFCTAIEQGGEETVFLLLVDSEAPVAANEPGWQHLARRDRWEKPDQASADQCHLMIQCMETWFLADGDALQAFYGQGFNASSLPRHTDLEAVPKATVFKSLEAATRQTKTKGRYAKSSQSFEILARVDPAKVRGACPSADRFLTTLASLAMT